ncbi:tyrosine recombinase XerC [Coralloluteibacterium thermophilus]|uniref:Tyrosine recombinase XerC n=1 Tax=Coralloluteibacterium thermophilum TaxID=2707049 RepID=A0ABV9NRA2_9GAMM
MDAAPAPDDALERARQDWLAHLRQRRLSAHTLDNYGRDLAFLAAWLRGQGIDDWDALRPDHLRAFVAHEHRDRAQSGKSLQRRLSAVRGFCRWRNRDRPGAIDPTAGLRAPRAPRKLPQVLDPDAMNTLVEVPADTPLGLRDRAMLELFYSSGLRVSELCGLRWRQLDLAEGLVHVFGKGRRERVVPVGRHAREALAAWRAESGGADDAPVFPGRGGRPITPRAVQLRVRALAQAQGVWARVHPHLLRHSFASHILESSGDLRGVQELLGHADIATTQIYTHLDFQHLARVFDGAHPRARRKREG